jgi:1,4-dihydroxy-6-naphthoate synthase
VKLHLGISTCPNDTFAFAALLEGRCETHGLTFETELCDVQELNERLAAGDFDLAKGSFAAALDLSADLGVLPSGSAIGFGNGPLLLAGEPREAPRTGDRVLCPGAHTTATLLYRTFFPQGPEPEQVVFDEIMPALERGEADLGVCIHEGRFTFGDHGLHRVCDLGERWEAETGAPLPLGGIFARRCLGTGVLRRAQAAVAASLDVARADPAGALPCMRRHAQELDDGVLQAHVDLYVNTLTRDLGPDGRAALDALATRAGKAPLAVLGTPRLFHLAPEDAWSAWVGHTWAPPSLAQEGFVHLSFAEQLAGTLSTHFPGAGPLVLAELDAEALAASLRLEPSREGALFPHHYGPLPRTAVLRTWTLGELPELGWE